MPALIDTNILVYRFDPRFPEKQQIAMEVLGLEIPQQTCAGLLVLVPTVFRGNH